MIPTTVDTNVLASGFIRPEPPPGRILAAWRAGLFTLIISAHILDELARTLETPYFSRYLTPAHRAANLALLRKQATITSLSIPVAEVATHREDDLVLATALSGAPRLCRCG